MILQSPTDNRYYIKPRSVIFSENDMGDPDRIYVSIASGTTIMVNIPDVIPFDEDKQYRKWVLSGYSTKLGTTSAYYVYAKLNRSDNSATISFSTKKYDVNGSVDGSEASEDYFYILIGSITATDGTSGRTLTYDSGKLTTPDNSYTKEEVDNLVKPWEEMFLSKKEDDTAEGHITFEKGLTTSSVSMKGKTLTGIATSADSDKLNFPTDSDIATPAYVEAHGAVNFLSKTTDDTAAGKITFEKGLRSEGDVDVEGDIYATGDATVEGETKLSELTIGDFIEIGDIIQGAKVTKEGVGSFAGLKSPFMQIYELILNRKTAVQGEFAFSDGDTVDNVTLNEDGTYTLALREQYKGYMTSFDEGDIVYSNVNLIGQSGGRALTGKCWMRVNEVAEDGLHLNVTLYADGQVPSGKNLAPQPHMVITRHGNDISERTDRQNVWVISSEDRRMYMLTGVTSPKIDTQSCYATVIGVLPDVLAEYVEQHTTTFNREQPYVYARGAVVQDLIQLNYKGQVIRTENYRGVWSAETAVNDPYESTSNTYDTVTHNGSKWEVKVNGTTVEPALNTTEWTQIVAKGDSFTRYTLRPSVNSIYLRGDVLSTNSLDVEVNENTSEGLNVLDQQDELNERGLKVQYSIDGKGERTDLTIGGDYAIELEDETGIIVDETDGDILYLEGESIDISAIEDNITLYLVDVETGRDLEQYIIPVTKDGEKGEKGDKGDIGRATFTSFVFIRSNPIPSTPKGGDYNTPLPDAIYGWSDGIPAGEEIVWMSSRVFSSDGMPPQTSEWTTPQQLTDTETMDVQFSKVESNPATPSTAPDNWSDTSDQDTIWMAINRKKNGVWTGWQISKIKGEKGENGTSIKVAGSRNSVEELMQEFPQGDGDNCYIIGEYLYVWNGTEWANVGKFAGKNGTSTSRLDLDNQMDTMLYDSDGNLLSGAITSNVSLYVGNDKITDAEFSISTENVEAVLDGSVITVTSCNATSGKVTVTCIYDGTVYTSVMTIKRIVNGVRYEIVTTPNVVTYNETTEALNPQAVTVEVYRTAQQADGTTKRERITSLPTGWTLVIQGNKSYEELSGIWTVIPDAVEYTFLYFKLVDSSGEVVDAESVPIVRVTNGDNGENGHSYTLQASVSSISQLVDAETGMTMTNEEEEVTFVYMIDGVPQPLDGVKNFISVTPSAAEDISVTFIPTTNGTFKANIKLKKDKTPTTKNLRFRIESMEGLPTVSTDIAISHPQRGLVGPAGEQGALLYPAGYWDEATEFAHTYDDEGNIVATPFVYYEKNGVGDYYVLQQDNIGVLPPNNVEYWKVFQKIDYVFTKALMANWARLAKAVFWNDYMFSSKGVNEAGEVVDHSAYIETMFDSETGRLSGSLIPNLFLDLENGLIKTNKLSETFRDFRSTYKNPEGDEEQAFADILNLGTSYNVKCNSGQRLLLMPLLSNINGSSVTVQAEPEEVDGVHSVITMLPNLDYESKVSGNLFTIGNGEEPATADYAWPNVTMHCMLVCADPRIFSRHSYRDDLYGYADTFKYAPKGRAYNHSAYFPDDGDMFFSVNGTLTKWLLLEAGTTANLRLVKDANSNHIWIVENAGDFEQLDVKVQMGINGTGWVTGGVIGMGSYNGNDELQDLGINRTGRFYGSKRLRTLYDYSKESGIITIEIEENPTIEDRTTPISIANEITLVN